STVSTVGYPMGGNKLSITKGVVSRIEMQDYSHSGADVHLAIQIDAPINPGNSGGPVLQDGKVAGVAFQLQFFAQSLGYMIPPSVMRHFLEDIQDGTYDGYPELGVYTANLQNDTLRAYLGVPEGKAGVLVLKPMPYASAVGQLRRNDVLHEIDGIPIENDGTIKVNGEFFEFTHVVESKQIGDTVTLTVRRDGKVIEVPIKLKKWDVRMSPAIAYDERPEYLVYGGYLFVPVATNYLFRARSSDELTYYYRQYYRIVAKEGKTREQLVVLSRVLPHASTRYRAYRNAIVALVNGVEPRDFKHFVELVETCKGNLVKVDFEGVNVAPLILDKAKIAEVHEKICKRFGVTEDRYVKGD
ncbi:MAG: S1C family serine protease, partial [Planctomycetota bacterium]